MDPHAARLHEENEELRARLTEAEDALRALQAGEVDAVIVNNGAHQVFTLETADRPYRLLVEQMPQGAATLSTDGVIYYANSAFATLLGIPLNDLVGRRILDFVAEQDRAALQPLMESARAGQVCQEIALVRADGVATKVYLGFSAMREGPLGECLVMIDLSEQRHYHELQRAQQALHEADRRKDEFLAILSHELRNPLGPIRNAAHFLKLKGPQDDELRHPIAMIERQTAQMVRLIDDLLDVSRISRGVLELRPERLRLSDIVEAAVDACRDDLSQRGHGLRTHLPSEPVELEADRARLVQVFSNLIGNASKYTPPGGHIEIRARTQGNTLEVAVQDDGIGIPPEKLGEIFELFSQVDRSLEREGGLGIGLTLVREMVRLHGGSIEARSAGIGCGSEFVLRLPVAARVEPGPGQGRDVDSGAAPRPRRILVADDNRDAAESLALLLELSGHEVHKVYNGDAAMAAVLERIPEVSILDIGMPGMNGYEVAKRVRQQPWGHEVVLVALTGWGHPEDRQRAADAGFDAHLVKPVKPDALESLLNSLDGGRRSA